MVDLEPGPEVVDLEPEPEPEKVPLQMTFDALLAAVKRTPLKDHEAQQLINALLDKQVQNRLQGTKVGFLNMFLRCNLPRLFSYIFLQLF